MSHCAMIAHLLLCRRQKTTRAQYWNVLHPVPSQRQTQDHTLSFSRSAKPLHRYATIQIANMNDSCRPRTNSRLTNTSDTRLFFRPASGSNEAGGTGSANFMTVPQTLPLCWLETPSRILVQNGDIGQWILMSQSKGKS
ncbi:hypothetical protein BDW75DRAFT_202665 [Aspergillus navahoensis]